MLSLKSRLQDMEDSLISNEKTVLEIKEVLKDLAQHRDEVDWNKLLKLVDAPVHSEIQASYSSFLPPSSGPMLGDTCSFANSTPSVTDVQVCCI